MVKSVKGIDNNALLNGGKLNAKDKELITKQMDGWTSSNISKYSSAFGKLLGYSNDISDFIDSCAKYAGLLHVKESIVDMLDEMYTRCDPSNDCLRTAIHTVKNTCNSEFGIMLSSFEKGLELFTKWTLKELCSQMWDTVMKAAPVTVCLKAGLDVGITVSNSAFSTDATIKQYYAMQCLCDVRDLIAASSVSLAGKFRADKTEKNAEAYISSVDFIYDSFVLSTVYVDKFYKLVEKDNNWKKIKNWICGENEDYVQLHESCHNTIENTNWCHRHVKTDWAYYLEEDFPELYNPVCIALGLDTSANLAFSTISLDKQIYIYNDNQKVIPAVSVYKDGKKLTENTDYTVSLSGNTMLGMGIVTINGIGSYGGTNKTRFFIRGEYIKQRVDIKELARAARNAAPTGGTASAQRAATDSASLRIKVYKETALVASVENGAITKNDVSVSIDGDTTTVLMPDGDYSVVMESDDGASVNYGYTKYNSYYSEQANKVYNALGINAGESVTQTINGKNNTAEMKRGSTTVAPDYDLSRAGTKHTVSTEKAVASSVTASPGEWVSISAVVPKGYTFVRWESAGNITISRITNANTDFVMGQDAVTVTAVLKPITYTVAYNGNGATGGTMADSSHTYGVSKELSQNGFKKDGYVFLGWSTASDATRQTYTDGQSVDDLGTVQNENVTLYAIWKKPWENPFVDVKSKDWFYDAVEWANENQLVLGITKTAFAPNGEKTRAMFVTIFGRMNGVSNTAYPENKPFPDVATREWYSAHVFWAAKNGVVNGYSDGDFKPTAPVTRQEMAVIIYNFMKSQGYDMTRNVKKDILDSYKDGKTVPAWAKEAVTWALSVGLMNGYANSCMPTDTATRSQVVQLLDNFSNLVFPVYEE